MKIPLQAGLFGAAILILIALLGMVFGYVHSHEEEASGYLQEVSLLRQLKQLDAQWELDTLKAKTGLHRNYDPLVQPLRELEALREQINALATVQLGNDAESWDSQFQAYTASVEQKAALIERFKSHNAILQNSLTFLPTLSTDIHHSLGEDQDQDQDQDQDHDHDHDHDHDQIHDNNPENSAPVIEAIDHILMDALVYTQTPSDTKAADILSRLDELAGQAASLPTAFQDYLDIFVAHVRTLLREQAQVNRLLDSITDTPVAAHIDALESLISNHQQAAEYQAQIYLVTLLVLLSTTLLLIAMRLIHNHRLLKQANQQITSANERLEQRVRERTAELQQTQAQLLDSARQAGMAEIATNVLHNVGNVLNSVNISASQAMRQVRSSKLQGLGKTLELINQHPEDLGDFLRHDDKGKLLPGYLNQLDEALQAEQRSILDELNQLTDSVSHIKEIIVTQQAYAKTSSLLEPIKISELIEDALRMNNDALNRHHIRVVKQVAEMPPLLLDKSRLLLILVNLISNAKHAMTDLDNQTPTLTLSVEAIDGKAVRIDVQDEGEGIAAENLTRIFAHGFTTRKDGHGFGLHSCATAAMEMGGSLIAHSAGPGKGAVFSLEIPYQPVEATGRAPRKTD